MQWTRTLAACAALAAACLTAPGPADAAVIDRIEIVSPDSGQVRGIDSLVVVEVATRTTQADSGLALFVWLVEDGADSLVLADTTAFGAAAVTDTIKAAIGASAGHFAARAPSSFLAARRARQASLTPVIGDGDSITFSTRAAGVGIDTLVFRWYVRIPASVGTFERVRAAATVHDPVSVPTLSAVSVSDASGQIGVDGDRPPQGTMSLNAVRTGGGVSVSGFSGAAARTALGIGDTVALDFDLGNVADGVILFNDSLSLVASIQNRTFPVPSPAAAAATFERVLLEGDFGDLPDPPGANSDTVSFHLVDPAGNWSSAGVDDVTPTGVNQAVAFVVDTRRPDLGAAVVDGDTLVLGTGDTLSDGTLNSGFADDENPLFFNLAEGLDSLLLSLDGPVDATVSLKSGRAYDHTSLQKAPSPAHGRRLDFTRLGGALGDTLQLSRLDGSEAQLFSAGAGNLNVTRADSLRTGLYTVSLTPTDLAGNTGPAAVRADVYVDVDDIELIRLSPTGEGGLDSLNAETARVAFRLSEPADSVLIAYRGLSGPDAGNQRVRSLSGSELANTGADQICTVEGLVHGSRYVLSVLARDLAGNFAQSLPDTFVYDTTSAAPQIAAFSLSASQSGLGSPLLAGDEITLTVQASTADGRTAVGYAAAAEVQIDEFAGNGGVEVLTDNGRSPGVQALGDGRFALDAQGWVNGRRSLVLRDLTAADTLLVSITGPDEEGATLSASLDSLIAVVPRAYSGIALDAPASAVQGEAFWVEASLVDTFGNVRRTDSRFIEIVADKAGVEHPAAAYIENGAGGFWALSRSYAGGDLRFVARSAQSPVSFADSLAAQGAAETGAGLVTGRSGAVEVGLPGALALDPPDRLEGSDYKGADGQGDQGGFVVLSFDLSDDHEDLSGYRIWRQIEVEYAAGDEGLVALDTPQAQLIPWGLVDAVPGVEGVMHVVVATLDNAATPWAVSAERGRATTFNKAVAPTGDGGVYEKMAETLRRSRLRPGAAPAGPVAALLTPQARAYIAGSRQPAAPLSKEAAPAGQSAKTYTAGPVEALDDLPPAPVTRLSALDVPGDAGGRVALRWGLSPSDAPLSRSEARALGGETFTAPGVLGYRVYRSEAGAAFAAIGETAAGAASFVDERAFNGRTYTYQVRPFDGRHEAGDNPSRRGLAVRDRVLDRDGQPLTGLLGANHRVDFDDYFALAARYGSDLNDEAFEPAFDLNPDARIDAEDIAVLSRNFGRGLAVSVRTDSLQGHLSLTASPAASPAEPVAVTLRLDGLPALKSYGFELRYDPAALAFEGVRQLNGPTGGALAEPRVLSQGDGALALAAHGLDAADAVELVLRFRPLQSTADAVLRLATATAESQAGQHHLAGTAVRLETLPAAFALAGNFPNPFNPSTALRYELPVASEILLEVFNAAGQRVRTLVDGQRAAGRYLAEWDATDDGGRALATGVYFYRLRAGTDFVRVRKMLLVK